MKKLFTTFFFVLLTSVQIFAQTSFGEGVGASGGASSSYFGTKTGQVSIGLANTFIGGFTAGKNTSGDYNTAVGTWVMPNNTTGAYNTVVGYQALYDNTEGTRNTAIGVKALAQNTTAHWNVAVGYHSLYSNTTGTYNTSVGTRSLYENVSANYNTAFGYETLYQNKTGEYNTALGSRALAYNETGGNNTAVGLQSLHRNVSGSYNVALGVRSLGSNETGIENCGFGYKALYKNTSGHRNTSIGYKSLANNNGGYNTSLGYRAGFKSEGSYNVFLGAFAGVYENGANKLYIENSATTSPLIYGDFVTNELSINTSSTGYTLNVNGSVAASSLYIVSDERFKQDMKQIDDPLTLINSLKGYKYSFKESVQLPEKETALKIELEDDDLEVSIDDNVKENDGIRVFDKGEQYGFKAQEVKKVLPELVSEDNNGYLSVNYNGFIPLLVEAVNKLSQENEMLKKELSEIKDKIGYEKGGQSNNFRKEELIKTQREILFQNQPNPADGETLIKYDLPTGAKSGQMIITNSNGKVMKVVPSLVGKGEYAIKAGELNPGAYIYTLIVDGMEMYSKTMVIK